MAEAQRRLLAGEAGLPGWAGRFEAGKFGRLAALGQRVLELDCRSKWSSITPLLRPVTKMKCSMPASLASSTTCVTGRSTTVSISFGIALVAGRKRVPSPATGKTAFDASSHQGPR